MATRQTAAQKRAAAEALLSPDAPQVPGGALELVDSSEGAAREVLFTYRGRAYDIPVEAERGDGMTYAHLLRTAGADIAVDWAMETMLGREGYAAFRQVRGLTQAQCDWVVGIVTSRVAGGGDIPKSSPPRS